MGGMEALGGGDQVAIIRISIQNHLVHYVISQMRPPVIIYVLQHNSWYCVRMDLVSKLMTTVKSQDV